MREIKSGINVHSWPNIIFCCVIIIFQGIDMCSVANGTMVYPLAEEQREKRKFLVFNSYPGGIPLCPYGWQMF